MLHIPPHKHQKKCTDVCRRCTYVLHPSISQIARSARTDPNRGIQDTGTHTYLIPLLTNYNRDKTTCVRSLLRRRILGPLVSSSSSSRPFSSRPSTYIRTQTTMCGTYVRVSLHTSYGNANDLFAAPLLLRQAKSGARKGPPAYLRRDKSLFTAD